MKYIVNFLRIVIGAFFIFSGFVKAVDPVGTSYKNHEYFEAFASVGMQGFWEQMSAFSLSFAVFMFALEIVAGICLLIGWMPRITVWIFYLMTMFFTLLTGFTYLSGYSPNATFGYFACIIAFMFLISGAIYNSKYGKAFTFASVVVLLVFVAMSAFTNTLLTAPFDEAKMKVTDCGCFGDFMKLKPWETFYKDVVLDVLIFLLVIGYKHIKPIFSVRATHITTAIASVVTLLFCFSNFAWGLPLIDFRAYKIGNNIKEQRIALKPEVREMVFVYKNKKTGVNKKFSMEELNTMNSDDWDYVSREDNITDPGIPAKIRDFFVNDNDGVDITDSLLNDPNYSLWIVARKLGETHADVFTKKLNPLAASCEKAGIKICCLTSGDVDIEDFRHEHQTAYPFYTADDTPLKTMIRSNPGLMLIKNGIVIDMWHYMHFPSYEELNAKYFSKK